MTATTTTTTAADSRDLTLTRHINATPERVFAAWTQPDLLRQWFAPKPVQTTAAEMDVRPGGTQKVVMRLPDGQEMPHQGVYLEVVPGRRLVFTSVYRSAWEHAPEAKPGTCDFQMTAVLTFEPEGSGTRYHVQIHHTSVADREAHEAMGFHSGWGQCTDQLAALVEGPAVIAPTRVAGSPRTAPAGRTVSAYLNFDGRCAEALAFYEKALGVETQERMLFKDAPPSDGAASGGCGTSNPDLIMHAAFRVGETLVMASDCHGAGRPAFAGISLALGVADAADAARCFEALSPGGSVCMPLGATFWSAAFGVVTDRFGVTWMINAVCTRA